MILVRRVTSPVSATSFRLRLPQNHSALSSAPFLVRRYAAASSAVMPTVLPKAVVFARPVTCLRPFPEKSHPSPSFTLPKAPPLERFLSM